MSIFDFPEQDYLYLLNNAGDDIQVNDDPQTYKALINNLPVNRQADIRTIASTAEIKRGDYITWDNETWLIISEIGHKRYSYYKGIIQKCNYIIKMIFADGIIREYPCIVDGQIFDVEANRYIPIPAGKVIVLMQDNEQSRLIANGRRFIHKGNAFTVTGIDKTQNGMIKLYAELDAVIPADDIVNEVADYQTHKHTFTIQIQNGDPLTINILEVPEIDIVTVCTDNGIVVSPEDITFTISDPLVARIEGNKLICIGTGTATLTASWNGVSDSITIIHVIQEVHNYAVTIYGADELKANRTSNYTAIFTDNGNPIEKVATWTLTDSNGLPTSNVTLSNVTNNSCTLTANQNYGYSIKLTVSAVDGTCSNTKIIYIASLI